MRKRRALWFMLHCSSCFKPISVECEQGENLAVLKDLNKVHCDGCGAWLLIRVYGGQKPKEEK